ncbi:MAG TPA: amidohydrolase family protein [Gemmatimonadales bacterium]|nr:amidohydrolase family protein [Gemmatimonadales bacterium]
MPLRTAALLTGLVCVASAAWGQAARGQRPIAIVHATVIDGTGAGPRRDQTVLVRGSRIAAVGPTGRVRLPPGTRVIDATGKVLIPGLWDAHVHLIPEIQPRDPSDTAVDVYLPMLLANGVTAVRDMGGELDSLVGWRRAIAGGRLVGPRLFTGGPKLKETDPAKARNAVRRLARAGVDFIKVGSEMSREAYFAAVDEARRVGLPVVGHVPEGVTVLEAAAAGQRSIEHLNGVLLAASADPRSAEALLELASRPADPATRRARTQAFHDRLLDTFSEEAAGRLFRRLEASRTWQVPTLTGFAQRGFALDTVPMHAPWVRYAPPGLMAHRTRAMADRRRSLPPRGVVRARRYVERHLMLVGAMRRAGVPIVAGTDTPSAAGLPGFSLHGELELLVQAGLSPMEALVAATLEPARLLGVADSLGSIAPGKVADLVLLEADPLERIGNTRRVVAVVAAGQYRPRGELVAMLERVGARVVLARREGRAAASSGAAE